MVTNIKSATNIAMPSRYRARTVRIRGRREGSYVSGNSLYRFRRTLSLGDAACSSSSSNQSITVTITAAPSSLLTSSMCNVVSTVANDSANSVVTWYCTPAASCSTASFYPYKTSSGATSSFTALSTFPAFFLVTITATSVTYISFVSAPVNITITAAVVPSKNFSFYLTVEDAANLTIYSIAVVVEIAKDASADGSFAVLSGEQDYNDGDGITVTDDSFTTGKLVLAAIETVTLTLITTSGVPGVNGTETFAVSFPNNNHALITQFDASATASIASTFYRRTAYPLVRFPLLPTVSILFSLRS